MKRSELQMWTVFINKAGSQTLVFWRDREQLEVLTERGSIYRISTGWLTGQTDDLIKDYKLSNWTVEGFFFRVHENIFHNDEQRNKYNRVKKYYFTQIEQKETTERNKLLLII